MALSLVLRVLMVPNGFSRLLRGRCPDRRRDEAFRSLFAVSEIVGRDHLAVGALHGAGIPHIGGVAVVAQDQFRPPGSSIGRLSLSET